MGRVDDWSFCGMADSSLALFCDLSEGQPLNWNLSLLSGQQASMPCFYFTAVAPLVQRGGLFCLLVYLTPRKPYELRGQVLSFAFLEATTGSL